MRVDVTAASPIRTRDVAYALHFYAGGGGQAYVRGYAEVALASGTALFVTESGIGAYVGNGVFNYSETEACTQFLEQHQLSSTMWAVSGKDETSSMLTAAASGVDGWSDDQLTAAGRFIRGHLGGQNATPVAPEAFAGNRITQIEMHGRVCGLDSAFGVTGSHHSSSRLRTVPSDKPFGYANIPR